MTPKITGDYVKIGYLRNKIIEWHHSFFPNFPWRTTKNKWLALVAEIMLQRTKANQVLPVYLSFAKKYRTPNHYLCDNNPRVFESLGLHWREKQLHKLARILKNSEIPCEKDSLKRLPAIGDYIAAAFRSLHLEERDFIIDSNVVRIYGRFFGFKTDGETRRKGFIKELSDQITPKRKFKAFNYGLIDFTRTICTPKPLCSSCILRRKCIFFKTTRGR